MAALEPGILHGLYTEQDIKIKFRCNHVLQNLNPPAAHPEHEHLAFIIIFEHQKREEILCSENLHLLPLIASATDYQKWHPRPNYTLSAPPLPGLPVAPEWPGPSPLLKGYLVPVFLEKPECPPASASRNRMFEYLGYQRIMSIEYHRRSCAKGLGAHELLKRLHKEFGELFRSFSSSTRPKFSEAMLSCLKIEDAILTIESVEESKVEGDAIPKQEGSGGNGCVKAVVREEGEDDWDMVPEAPTMRLINVVERDGWMMM